MTYTKAQILLINSAAQYRSTNYGKHPKEVFNIDETMLNNSTYNNIIKSINLVETNYDNTIEELDILISEAQTTYAAIRYQQFLLESMPTYIYNLPNKQTYISLINQINTLIQDCNNIIIDILNNRISNVSVYVSQLLINEVASSLLAVVNKEWLFNYINSVPKIPRIRLNNADLVCNSDGQIQWQQ